MGISSKPGLVAGLTQKSKTDSATQFLSEEKKNFTFNCMHYNGNKPNFHLFLKKFIKKPVKILRYIYNNY